MTATAGVVFYFDWEMRFMEWLQAHVGSSGFGFWLLSNLSAFGEQLLLVAIMGFLYWGLNKEFGKYVGLNVLMVNVWNPMIKNIVLRLRPYFVPGYNVKLLRLIDENADAMDIAAQGYSFPSGHSANAVTVYGSLAAHEKKRKLLWVLAVVLPLLVGFSRVFVGAHYPTDVLCGWLLGVIIVALIPWLRRAIRNRWLFYAVLLLSALPGFFFCTSNDYYSSFGMLLGFVLAEPFEEKFVKFENTSNIFRCILRTLGGGLIYFGLNEVLKLPFPKELLSAGTLVSQLIRMLRYAVVIFVVIGVYPLLFKLTGKLWSRKGQKRKAYSVMLVLVLCLSLLAPAQAAAQSDDTRSAIATNNTIVVSNSTDQPDAHVVHPAVYKIEGENYFKLRDLAMLLKGSAKQFAVNYVDAAKPVSITSGKPYEAIGGELSGVAAETASANISNDAITINGNPVSLTAFKIDGANYFRLWDLSRALDFYVGYNDGTKTVFISGAKGYEEAPETGAQNGERSEATSIKTGIIGAMDEEVATLKAALKNRTTTTAAGMEFCEGTLDGAEVVVVKCGIGKVNAGSCAQLLINVFGVDRIINTGVAGSLDASIDIGDIVVSTDAVQHDFDLTPLGYALGELDGIGAPSLPADTSMRESAVNAVKQCAPEVHVFEGRVCTGDQFIASPEQKEAIVAAFGGLCCEMEGGAIAQICVQNNIPFVILRAISDKADGSEEMSYLEFEHAAAVHCAAITRYMVSHG